MVVGIGRIVLGIPEARSLKDKRSVVRRVIDRARAKFNAAIAEVGDQDLHRRAVIGVSVVSNDRRHANEMLDTILSFVSGASEALVLDRSIEIETYDDHFGLGAASDG
jgi:uncharacterized protein YlxP (DUF503 family)